MATSSDWINAPAGGQNAAAAFVPSWMGALSQPGGFVEGLPFANPAATAITPGEPAAREPAAHGPETTDQPDLVEEAYAKGLAEGRTAAHAEAEAETAKQTARARDLRLAFQTLDEAGITTLAEELAETVIALCGETIEDFEPNARTLLTRCKAAADRLGSAAGTCALHLNPEDLEMVDPETLGAWRTVADPAIERGGLRFEGPDGCVSDGPHEWRRAIAAAIRG